MYFNNYDLGKPRKSKSLSSWAQGEACPIGPPRGSVYRYKWADISRDDRFRHRKPVENSPAPCAEIATGHSGSIARTT